MCARESGFGVVWDRRLDQQIPGAVVFFTVQFVCVANTKQCTKGKGKGSAQVHLSNADEHNLTQETFVLAPLGKLNRCTRQKWKASGKHLTPWSMSTSREQQMF